MISFLLLILLALCRAGQACFQRSGKCSIYLFSLANWHQSKKVREKEHRTWQEKVAWAPLSSPAPVGGLVSSSVKWVPIVLSLPPWVLVRGQSQGETFYGKRRYKWRPVVSVNHLLPPGASLGGREGKGSGL